MRMDQIDRKILAALQEDAGRPVADIAAVVGLSQSPCWRRIQKLEADGVIRRRVALLDAAALNLGVTAFVAVRTNRHDPEWLKTFAQAVEDIPEVVELYRMSGEVDYMLRVVVPDIAGFDAVYKKLIARVPLSDVTSSFAMEQIKSTTALPLEYI
jgi:Lrp/AsnC family transcriptional regulator